ncbi:MAG TPA: thymidylate kinase, partial [Patescibacteria group bacterium]|nr:thymidylate kinase [Patescibacteria group bacterium]
MKKSRRGLFIVLEGTDGSGKGTQFKLLVSALRRVGKRVATLDFPQYGKKSAYFVEQYLNGRYGSADSVSPYIASLFYALDRYAAKQQLNDWLKQGRMVVANRFILSNAAHQGAKIKSKVELNKYWRWLFNLEYGVFGLPKPDLTILLQMPAEVAHKLVLRKSPRRYLKSGAKRDIHEADHGHLRAAEARYLTLAKLVGAKVVKCVDGG